MMLAMNANGTDPLLGTTVGQYRVARVLGEGAFGRVYEVIHLGLGSRAAMKVLHAQFSANPAVVQRFRREAEVVASLNHPNVVSILEFGRLPDGRYYNIMEFVDGMSLAQYMKTTQNMPPAEIMAIVRGISDALAAMHERGIVHRDLKPDNIMLSTGGLELHVKILDFGIARLHDYQGPELTQSGQILGTPAYMAPEQAKGEIERIGPWTDIYALGVMLYQMLSGRLPIEGRTTSEILVKILTEAPVPLNTHIPGISVHLDGVIQKALSKDTASRYHNVRDFYRDFEAAMATAGGGPVQALPVPPPPPPPDAGVPVHSENRPPLEVSEGYDSVRKKKKKKRRVVLGAGLVVAVLVLVAAGYAFYPRERSQSRVIQNQTSQSEPRKESKEAQTPPAPALPRLSESLSSDELPFEVRFAMSLGVRSTMSSPVWKSSPMLVAFRESFLKGMLKDRDLSLILKCMGLDAETFMNSLSSVVFISPKTDPSSDSDGVYLVKTTLNMTRLVRCERKLGPRLRLKGGIYWLTNRGITTGLAPDGSIVVVFPKYRRFLHEGMGIVGKAQPDMLFGGVTPTSALWLEVRLGRKQMQELAVVSPILGTLQQARFLAALDMSSGLDFSSALELGSEEAARTIATQWDAYMVIVMSGLSDSEKTVVKPLLENTRVWHDGSTLYLRMTLDTPTTARLLEHMFRQIWMGRKSSGGLF